MSIHVTPIPITSLAHSELTGVTATQHHTAPEGWDLVGEVDFDDDAVGSVSGLANARGYAIILSNMVPASDGAQAELTLGDSGGEKVGASDYGWYFDVGGPSSSADSFDSEVDPSDDRMRLGGSTGSAAGEGMNGTFFLEARGNGSVLPMIQGRMGTVTAGGPPPTASTFAGAFIASVLVTTAVYFRFSTGNVASGNLAVYALT